MKIAFLITARLKSTRLPMKVIKPMHGKPMMVHMLDRLKESNSLYENDRPGVGKRISDYNNLIEKNVTGDFVDIMGSLLNTEGFSSDGIHWNKSGHKVVSEILLDKINAYLANKTKGEDE